MSEGLLLFAPLDAPADLRAETAVVPISPLDEVRVLRPGTEVEVEVEVAEGETGELAARGPYTICGYLAAPDRDREAFTAEGFYRSGDLVRARRYEGSLSSWSRGTPPLPRWPWSACLIPTGRARLRLCRAQRPAESAGARYLRVPRG